MIPVHLKGRVCFVIKSNKERQNSLRSFCRFGHYFASVGEIDTASLTREYSYILCPNFENFCPNNGQFFSFRDATAFPASPCHTHMLHRFVDECTSEKINFYQHITKLFCPSLFLLHVVFSEDSEEHLTIRMRHKWRTLLRRSCNGGS